ncbi:ATP-dependent DNA/RNA helicase DHX36 [Diachasma alloeum]|uniref:ATP-dependent DNA/RNA helicase DHX36 n=1 Tax=Diachasma alloeum TaxID=454923 RepID=UPI00073829B6|nr:ATP-dependent DNA/RNA helicase DHX36 [Diachasma alloeum]
MSTFSKTDKLKGGDRGRKPSRGGHHGESNNRSDLRRLFRNHGAGGDSHRGPSPCSSHGGASSHSEHQSSSRGGRARGRGRGLRLRSYDTTRYGGRARVYGRRERYFHLDPMVQRSINSLLSLSKTPYPRESDSNDPDSNDQEAADSEDKYSHIEDSKFKREFLDIVSGSFQENLLRSLSMSCKLIQNDRLNKKLKDEQCKRESLDNYKEMQEFRAKLPSYKMKDEILDLIRGNQVVVISGETGCGKTTQVAQFILDDEIKQGRGSTTKIVCTQPRRISAISVAERVAAERAETLGRSVGYQIRLERIVSRDYGSMLFCTTGLLLQYMRSDPALRDFSHIILDEIHERSTDSDLIITLLKQIIPKRPDLKVVLMSATLNSETFAHYYDDCPNIHIPGFIYPVEEFYLEDILVLLADFRFPSSEGRNNLRKFLKSNEKSKTFTDFIEPTVKQMEAERSYPLRVINELKNWKSEDLNLELIEELLVWISASKGPGAILVFLPGMLDISNLNGRLLNAEQFPADKFHIYPLHSKLPTVDQKLIFETPIEGVRKIILATSIAETSITIEDVVYVVDCGRSKLTRFDLGSKLETLESEWECIANAKQRKGRAGRVQPGEVYRLYTRVREQTFKQFPPPEILRTPLEQVILQVKMLQLGKAEVFLGRLMDPPEDKAIHLALDLLRSLNALDSDENLTPLGYHLAKLPLDPRTGKMILLASFFSCVDPVFGIAASLAFKEPFLCPLNKEEEAKKAKFNLGVDKYSDHIALAEALRQYERALRKRAAGDFCHDNFLSRNTLKLLIDMKRQFAGHLHEMKFLESDNPKDASANRNSHNTAMVKAIICAALYPNVAIVDAEWRGPDGVLLNVKTSEDGPVRIHPRSINSKITQLPSPYVTYFLKQKSGAIFLHDTTFVSEAALILAAPECTVRPQGQRSQIILGESLSFPCNQSTGRMIQRLREEMHKVLEHKITHPGAIKWQTQEDRVIGAIIELVSETDFSRYCRSWDYRF